MTDLRPPDSSLSRAVRGAALVSAMVLCANAVVAARGGAQGTDTTHAAASATPANAAGTTPAPVAPGADAAQPAHDTTTVMSAADSGIQRAQAFVAQGHTDQGRSLVDSILAVTPPSSPAYASALYARASLATNADSAEDDYRRITVDYSTSPRVSDALLRLAQLELARGDRAQAADHLARLTREQLPGQSGVTYARTELQVGLAYFDLQDLAHACAALVGARNAAPTTDVELRNRIDYNIQRCPRAAFEPAPAAAASMSPPPAAASAAARDSARRAGERLARSRADSAVSHKASAATTTRPKANATAPAASPPASPPSASAATPPAAASSATRRSAPGFTVQVAAYPTRAAAESLAAHLRERGYESRVFGTAAPFRVRVGRYPTEAAADAVERALKAKGMEGFVTAAEPANP